MQLHKHSKYWNFLSESARKRDLDNGFLKHLIKIALPIEKAYRRMLVACKSEPVGFEFAFSEGTRWAFIAPSIDEPEKWLIRYFDANGFSGHETYSSVQIALEYMANVGCTVPAKGALDIQSATRLWARGLVVQEWRDQFNFGKLDWKQMSEGLHSALVKFDQEHEELTPA